MLYDELEYFNNLDEEEEVVKFFRFNLLNFLFYLCLILLFINYNIYWLLFVFNLYLNIGIIGVRFVRIY